MEKEGRRNFYKAASPYKPTYYWLDVEEKTMKDMNAGVEAFRAKLQALGAKNIGLYIGTYFMEEHSISTLAGAVFQWRRNKSHSSFTIHIIPYHTKILYIITTTPLLP